MMNRNLPVLFAAAAAVITLIIWLNDRFPGVLSDAFDKLDPPLLLLLLALSVFSLVLHRRFNDHPALKHLGIVMLLGTLVFAGFNFLHEPEYVEVRFPISAGGRIMVEAKVDGVPVHFLVDTGASDVVLSPRDAECIGFDHAKLRFDQAYRTASGTISGAPVTLGQIAVGPIHMKNVKATVNGRAMDTSLLGMSFLSRLSGFSVTDGTLILRD